MKILKLPKNNTHFEQISITRYERFEGIERGFSIENSGLDQASPALYIYINRIQIIGKPANGSTLIPFDNLK
jgi:hypothetical protein